MLWEVRLLPSAEHAEVGRDGVRTSATSYATTVAHRAPPLTRWCDSVKEDEDCGFEVSHAAEELYGRTGAILFLSVCLACRHVSKQMINISKRVPIQSM